MTIAERLQSMTLRQKVEQTVVVLMKKGKKIDFNPGAAFFFGQIITQSQEEGIDELKSIVKELYRPGQIPPLVTSDFEHGCGSMVKALTVLPYMMGLGAANDEQLAYDFGKATALEARMLGANWTFSPVCDLNINPRNPITNNRAMTDNPDLACRLLPQIVQGMQDHGLAACAKHFPGDGMDYRDQHITTTVNSLTMEQWHRLHGRVFKTLIDSGVDTIMPGHIALPAYPQELSKAHGLPLPATLNKALLTDLLKGELGFQGIVVSDAVNMGGFSGWYDTQVEAEIESFKAGCDMILWPRPEYPDRLEQAVLSGEVSMERLDDAVTRILTVKEKRNLLAPDFDPFYQMSAEDESFVKSVQRRCADQSITMVRDRDGHFPINKEKVKRIGIVTIARFEPAKEEAKIAKEAFEARGFQVEYFDGDAFTGDEREAFYARNDLVINMCFSRPYRPAGFLDYMEDQFIQVRSVLFPPHSGGKTAVVSFGSPYFGQQYFQKVGTYVNAYSMLSCVVEAFVRAACGEIPFMGSSPVDLDMSRLILQMP